MIARYFLLLGLFSSGAEISAQQYVRKQFDYIKMAEGNSAFCDSSVFVDFDRALDLLENNQSAKAVRFTEEKFRADSSCPAVSEIYAWSLFRNGRWMDGIDIIERAIAKFGSVPGLISKRAFMSLEMGEHGIANQTVDGNSLYFGEDKQLKFDDSLFRSENYKTALSDFEYLCTNYDERYQETLIAAYLYRQLQDFEKSSAYLKMLYEVEDYTVQALLMTAQNDQSLQRFEEAESILLALEKIYERSLQLQEALVAFYELSGDSAKAKEHREKNFFYQVTPSFSTFPFSPANFETLTFFATENTPEEKYKELDKIIRERDEVYSIEICLSILKMHANHDNRLEQQAADALVKFGKTAIPESVSLFKNDDLSTCTLTNLAYIFATVKDTAGWQPMVDYLPQLASLPFSLIPPQIPEMMMKFDAEKGARVLIEFAKQLIHAETQNGKANDKLADLAGLGHSVIYSPLKNLKKKKVINIARELNYSGEELNLLLAKIYN